MKDCVYIHNNVLATMLYVFILTLFQIPLLTSCNNNLPHINCSQCITAVAYRCELVDTNTFYKLATASINVKAAIFLFSYSSNQ